MSGTHWIAIAPLVETAENFTLACQVGEEDMPGSWLGQSARRTSITEARMWKADEDGISLSTDQLPMYINEHTIHNQDLLKKRMTTMVHTHCPSHALL